MPAVSLRNRLSGDIKSDESADILRGRGDFIQNERRSFMISFVNGPQGTGLGLRYHWAKPDRERERTGSRDQSPIKATPTKPMLRIYYVLSNCEFFFRRKPEIHVPATRRNSARGRGGLGDRERSCRSNDGCTLLRSFDLRTSFSALIPRRRNSG